MIDDTRRTTSYLKGLAILLVIITHYSGTYAEGFNKLLLRDYAGFFISIFFVMSGYGLYHTFRRLEEKYNSLNSKGLSLRLVSSFYWQRAIRIYPLYWLSILSASFLMEGWSQLHELSLRTVAIFLVFPTVRGPGFIWFIPALIQCYLLAPLLYLLLKRLKLRMFLMMIFALGTVFMFVSLYYMHFINLINGFGIPDPQALIYRSIFLSNVLLFAAGLAMPILRDHLKAYFSGLTTLLFFIATLASMYLVRDPNLLFSQSHFLLFPVFLISISCFCLSAVADNRSLPFSKPFSYLGRYSYPLYLFHWQYFTLLASAGLISGIPWQSALVTAALFPVFVLACVALQKGTCLLVRHPEVLRFKKIGMVQAEAD